MTDNKRRPGVASARERLRVERERDRQSAKRLRTLKMAGVVVLVLGVTALISVAVAVTGKDGSESTEARPVGTGAADAPVTMTVYEDFRCPACRQFEVQFGETINELRDAGKLRVDYHLVTLIDGNLGGHGSQYAAGAALCANDAGKFVEYHDVLYRNQPPEQKDTFGDKQHLLKVARQVEGLSTMQFEKCVQDDLKSGRVDRTQRAFMDSGYGQTPTVLVDGDRAFDNPADPLTPAKLRQLVVKESPGPPFAPGPAETGAVRAPLRTGPDSVMQPLCRAEAAHAARHDSVGNAMDTLAFIPSPSTGEIYLGPVPLRGYAFCIIIGVFLAVWLGNRRWIARGGRPGTVADIAVWAVPFGLVGGRLYHVITDYQLYFGEGRNWVDAFRIWDGGLGIWGAIALGGLGAWIGCRRRGIPMPAYADAVAPGIALAQGIGRWGNWFNQELYGRPTDLPWGVEIDRAHRPVESLDLATYHPTFLYESLWCVGVAVLVIWADRRFKLGHGRAFALYVAAYTAGRFWIEYLRIDDAHHVLGLRLNNWTALGVFLLAVAYIVISRRVSPGREEVVEPPAPGEEPGTGPDADQEDDGVKPENDASSEDSGTPDPASGGKEAPAEPVDSVQGKDSGRKA